MAFCTNCGKELPDNHKFCHFCGASVSEPMGQIKKRKMNPIPGIICFIAAIGLYFSDPPFVTIVGSVIVLTLCIIFLAKGIKVSGLPIAAIVIVTYCLLVTVPVVLYGKQGWFEMPAYSSCTGNTLSSNSETDSKPVSYQAVKGKHFKTDLPSDYSLSSHDTGSDYEKMIYRNGYADIIIISHTNESFPAEDVINKQTSTSIDNALQQDISSIGLTSIHKLKSDSNEIAGYPARTFEYSAQNASNELFYISGSVFAGNDTYLVTYFVCRRGKETNYKDAYNHMLEKMIITSSQGYSSHSGNSNSGTGSGYGSGNTNSNSSNGNSSSSTNTNTQSTSGNVSPDLKKILDSYEEFVDEYVAFMKKYDSGSSDSLSMLTDYLEMLETMTKWSTEISNLDSTNMSSADYLYYLDVTLRCTEKMLEAAY